MRVLLVEDDAMLGAGVKRGLQQLGQAVDWVHDGQAADDALSQEPYDVVLLDLGLPKKAGLEVLRDLRRRGRRVPVVILTAQDAVPDRVAGLDAGADDYLVKPFDLDELAARIRAVQRRSVGRAEPVIENGQLTLNPATHEVVLDGTLVPLSAREFALLHALLEHPGRPISRSRLEERLYGVVWTGREQRRRGPRPLSAPQAGSRLDQDSARRRLHGSETVVRSIRRTLLATLLAAVTAVTLAAALFTYRMARQQMDAIFDYHLRQLALSLRSPPAAVQGTPAELEFVIQIWAPSGLKLYASRPQSGLPDPAQMGFATVPSQTGDWRVYTTEESGLIVQVAQPLRVREQLAFAASMRTLAPVLLILPLLAFLVWRSVGRALAPLDHLAKAVGSRTPSALGPLPESGAPEEALPLVHSLNDLLGRLRAALDAQRAFVADAAHELRTPLAALKLQLQLVERAGSAEERAVTLADLKAGLERSTHVVQQLLTLARAEPEAAAALAGELVSLAEIVRQGIADHALLAEAKGVDLGATQAADSAVVTGDAAALRTLLANLLENAIRYTPASGRIDVDAGVAGGRPYLEVADNGPGIREADRKRVFDRFYRRGSGSESGTGLGLAIVKAIAERHRAAVSLRDTPGGGLTVRVDFPSGAVEPRYVPRASAGERSAGSADAPS